MRQAIRTARNAANSADSSTRQRLDAAEALRRKIRRLPKPASYFVAACRKDCTLPDNVLLFPRLEPMRHPPDAHYRFVLILNVMTQGTVRVDQTPFVLSPGHALLVFPYQFHGYSDFLGRDLRWLFITFETGEPDALRELKNVRVPLSAAALRLVEALCDLYLNRERGGRSTANRLALTLGLLLEELRDTDLSSGQGGGRLALESAPPPAREGTELGQRVGRLLEERLGEPMHIAQMARRLGISPSHLRNVFREQFGSSLGRYLRWIRLHKAVRLMGSTHLSLSEIADRCGYESLGSFSRTFKNVTNLSPGEYRRRMIAGTPTASTSR